MQVNKNTDLLMNFSNVIDQINCNNKKKNVILIDELESISSIEKSCILTLQKTNEAIKIAQIKKMTEAIKSKNVNKINQAKKINEQFVYCPIIFISNGENNKLLTTLKKNALVVKFWQPTLYDTHKILIDIATKEKIQFTNKKVANNILEHTQNDIRRTIFILQDLCETYEYKLITNDIVNDYKIISKKKDIDTDLFKSTKILLFNHNTMTDCMSHYERNKTLLPLMIHQNYIPNIIKNSKNIKENFDIIEKISHVLSVADVIKNNIYCDQKWNMQELHGLYTCGITSYYTNTLLNKNNKFQFATYPNKIPIKKTNKENIFDHIYSDKIIKYIHDIKYKNTLTITNKHNAIDEQNYKYVKMINNATEMIKKSMILDKKTKREHFELCTKFDNIKYKKSIVGQNNEYAKLIIDAKEIMGKSMILDKIQNINVLNYA